MIHAQFEMLAKSPHRGRLRDDLQPGLREHHAGSHTIFYVVEPKRITIVDILHERMDPALHLS